MKHRGFLLAIALMLTSLLLLISGCSPSDDNGGQQNNNNGNSLSPASKPVALAQLHWCNNKPSQVFMDESAPSTPVPFAGKGPDKPVNLGPANRTPVPIQDWKTFQANLGFTVFLPATLPTGSCLLTASGIVRSEILGSNFALTYLLPDKEALTISLAPQHTENKTLQCSVSDTSSQSTTKDKDKDKNKETPTPSPTATILPLQVCSGVRDTTNVTFSAHWKTEQLQQFFQDLKSDIEWIPAA